MIDRKRLLALVGDNEELADKLVDSFRRLITTQVSEMETCLETAQLDLLSNHAHVMKTQSDYMGLDQLSQLLQELEDLADGHISIDALRQLFTAVELEVDKIIIAEGWGPR